MGPDTGLRSPHKHATIREFATLEPIHQRRLHQTRRRSEHHLATGESTPRTHLDTQKMALANSDRLKSPPIWRAFLFQSHADGAYCNCLACEPALIMMSVRTILANSLAVMSQKAIRSRYRS